MAAALSVEEWELERFFKEDPQVAWIDGSTATVRASYSYSRLGEDYGEGASELPPCIIDT